MFGNTKPKFKQLSIIIKFLQFFSQELNRTFFIRCCSEMFIQMISYVKNEAKLIQLVIHSDYALIVCDVNYSHAYELSPKSCGEGGGEKIIWVVKFHEVSMFFFLKNSILIFQMSFLSIVCGAQCELNKYNKLFGKICKQELLFTNHLTQLNFCFKVTQLRFRVSATENSLQSIVKLP